MASHYSVGQRTLDKMRNVAGGVRLMPTLPTLQEKKKADVEDTITLEGGRGGTDGYEGILFM